MMVAVHVAWCSTMVATVVCPFLFILQCWHCLSLFTDDLIMPSPMNTGGLMSLPHHNLMIYVVMSSSFHVLNLSWLNCLLLAIQKCGASCRNSQNPMIDCCMPLSFPLSMALCRLPPLLASSYFKVAGIWWSLCQPRVAAGYLGGAVSVIIYVGLSWSLWWHIRQYSWDWCDFSLLEEFWYSWVWLIALQQTCISTMAAPFSKREKSSIARVALVRISHWLNGWLTIQLVLFSCTLYLLSVWLLWHGPLAWIWCPLLPSVLDMVPACMLCCSSTCSVGWGFVALVEGVVANKGEPSNVSVFSQVLLHVRYCGTVAANSYAVAPWDSAQYNMGWQRVTDRTSR